MGTSGSPTEYTMGAPEDVKGLRAQLIQLLQSGMRQGATPYTGPIAPQQNQMTLGAANMLSQMMGYGPYQQSGFMMNPYGGMSGGLNVPPPTPPKGEEERKREKRENRGGGEGGRGGERDRRDRDR